MAKEITCRVIKTYFSTGRKAVMAIQWGKNKPTIDIRNVGEDGTPFKGISLKPSDLPAIIDALKEALEDSPDEEEEENSSNRTSIDLLERIASSSAIVESREKGIITKNGHTLIKTTKKWERKFG